MRERFPSSSDASALDPRHKSLPFLSPAERAHVTAKLHEMAKGVEITSSETATTESSAAEAADTTGD